MPLTVQETLRFFGTEGLQVEAQTIYQNEIRTPAARQFLIEQLDGQNSTANYYTTYYTNLKNNGLAGSNGYPMNLRKVTLLNGTGNGTQTYGDYTQVLNGLGTEKFLNIKVFQLIENFLPSYNQTNQITLEKVTIPFYFGLTFIKKTYSVTNINPRGCMDAVPGSTRPTINEVYTKFSAGCPTICSFAIVGGSDPLCTTANTTYNLDANIPSGATTQWSTSSSLQIVSYTPNSVTVKEVANPTFSTITATIVNPCGANSVITRTIQTGPPVVTNVTSSMDNGGCSAGYQRWNLAATANSTVNSWQWTIDNAANNSWGITSPNSASTSVDVTNGTGGGITVSAANGCGTGKNGVTIYSPCGRKRIHNIAPNPAHDKIVVSTISEGNNIKNSQALMFTIKITDRYGIVRKSISYHSGVSSANISVADLKTGIYLVSIFNGAEWNSQSLFVQK